MRALEEEVVGLRARVRAFDAGPSASSDTTARALAEKSVALEEANGQLHDLTLNLDRIVQKRTRALAESEAQLRRRNLELDRLNRLKSEFIAVAAHELRTPMTAIIGYLDLLAEDRLGAVPAALRRPLSSLQRNAQRLRRFIDDLLDVSRLESGHMLLRRSSCDMNAIVRAAISEQEPFWGEKQHVVEFQAERALPPVCCDPDKIHQLVANLLANAIKYTPSGGRITLSTFQPDAAHLGLRIRDNGIGIPTWAHQKIFEPFGELVETRHHTSEAPDSAGLGLYIAKGIADLHSAELVLESEEGQFTEFTLVLPFLTGAPASLRT
jgi:signal transduction histidine kinase